MSEAPIDSEGPSADTIRMLVRDRYGKVATDSGSCCGGPVGAGCHPGGPCCSPGGEGSASGYSGEQLASLPPGAHLGLGCGNPTALVSLTPGDTVLDLGSGGGVDCFLVAKRVGPTGRVIGVDMTPEMVARARKGAREAGYTNVEFRLAEIEHLPVSDGTVDVVLSNCVINLAPDQGQVYREAFRVLRPGGRLKFSDMIATRPIPVEARRDPARWSGCSSGARSREEIGESLRAAGFTEVDVTWSIPPAAGDSLAGDDLGVVPGTVEALKPNAR